VGDEHRPARAAFEKPGQEPGGAGVPVHSFRHEVLVDLAAAASLGAGALALTWQRRPAKSKSSMLTPKISSDRPAVRDGE
jgi:hypothetical protein